MKIIRQSAHIVKDWGKMDLYQRCEFAGRISRGPLSERQIKEGSAEEFVRRMAQMGHESVFEFARIKFYESHAGVNVRTLREELKSGKHSSNYTRAAVLSEHYPAFFEDILKIYPLHEEVNVWLKKHNSMLFFDSWIPVIIITNRAISHQLVRYRKEVVYLQASQRFIKFHDDVDFISPDVYFDLDDKMYSVWLASMEGAEQDYIHCLSQGYSAQAARLFLPNSAATKLIMYASSATWKHVFEQRLTKEADPMIRELLTPLKAEFDRENLL